MANRFFSAVGRSLHEERVEGHRRGQPLSADGLDEILAGARRRAGLATGTLPPAAPHLLDPTAEAGLSLEAVQAQAGHRSIVEDDDEAGLARATFVYDALYAWCRRAVTAAA